MESDIQTILQKALNLSLASRAYIAEILTDSLEGKDDFSISDEWLVEIKKRYREIDENEIELLDGETAVKKLHKKYNIM